MNADYQLWEMADLLRYSTQLSICKSLLYYKNKTQVQMLLQSVTIASGLYYQVGRFHISLNCSHYNRIMIKRLRHYLDKSAFMKRASSLYCDISLDCDKLEEIANIHRKLFRSVKYSMKLRSLVQYFFVLGNPIFLHFRSILISLMKVVSPRLEMGIKC
ncbi:hypothetical protein T11_5417 [Trichinella zimbabwensis]|uniref:Uncharacterized protein n=1 Tax=Trichinella zimbabwensis TaxID=268475 RepID=A0A0V1GRT2_9BILA|nr:hypothetical protein T11_5417 [Trichinella zimbabwensis]